MKLFSKVFIIFLFIFNASRLYARQDSVTLVGVCNNKDIQEIKIVTDSHFWGEFTPSILVMGDKKDKDTFRLKFHIDKPRHASLMILGRTWHIYITPEDSLSFKIAKNNGKFKIHFTGKNEQYYNYNPKMEDFMNSHKYSNDYNKIIQYEKSLDNWYNWRITFFKQYKKEHTLSKGFLEYIHKEIIYEYVYRLYFPLYHHKVKSRNLPSNYFKRLKKIQWDKGNYIHFSNYSRLAYSVKYIFGKSPDNIWNKFDDLYSNLKNHFKGRKRDYLIANLIGIYTKKQLPGYRKALLSAIDNAPKYIRDSACLKYINRCRLAYLKIDRPFPSKILSNTYLKKLGTTAKLSLSDLLKRYESQAIYIDFWASWCGACINDINHSKEAKKIINERNVVYIYVSLDTKKDESKWKQASIENKISNNQYLLCNDFSSPLVKFLEINYLPRYMILNKKHKVVNINAPRPTKYHLTELKNMIGKLTQKVYHY